jgi:hypothetical protein
MSIQSRLFEKELIRKDGLITPTKSLLPCPNMIAIDAGNVYANFDIAEDILEQAG